jgi:hypothetical protein
MEPNEIIKHAPELLKGGAELVGAWKVPELIKTMFGPASAELAEMFRDEARRWRFERQLSGLEKTRRMVEKAGYSPKAVPAKILFQLLDGMSLEESDDLHTMWAALLANASSPEKAGKVRPGFIAILKQMAPDEAALLKIVADFTKGSEFSTPISADEARKILNTAHDKASERVQAVFPGQSAGSALAEENFRTCKQLLLYSGLAEGTELAYLPRLTPFGGMFLECCEPPKPPATTTSA